MLAQWTMDPQYIAVSDLFTKHGVYLAYKNGEAGATSPKTFLVRPGSEPTAGPALRAFHCPDMIAELHASKSSWLLHMLDSCRTRSGLECQYVCSVVW